MSLNITATEQSVSSLFRDQEFIIPVYQRPYSWGLQECETLWNDIVSHDFESEDSNDYFLGTIVLAPAEGKKKFNVIDGQQRLITLTLLLKALHDKNKKNYRLQESVYVVDDESDDKGNRKILNVRISSKVNGTNENKIIRKILLNDVYSIDSFEESNFYQNYMFFKRLVLNLDVDIHNQINKNLLNSVILLPIECGTPEQALTIFETINNRGLSLSDSDIFKSKLYEMAKEQGKENQFVVLYNTLIEDAENFSQRSDVKIKGSVLTYLFRCYMYTIRAKYKDISKPVNLRDFYSGKSLDTNKKKKTTPHYDLKSMDWHTVVTDIHKLLIAWRFILNSNNRIRNWWDIINKFGKDSVFYPALIYLFKNLNYDCDYPHLERRDYNKCILSFKNIIKYSYAKRFHKEIDGPSIDDEMFKASVSIYHNGLYECKKIWVNQDFIKKLRGSISTTHRRGFLMILMYLNEKQNHIISPLDAEHILPKKWDNNFYDIWNEENALEIKETLGNLVLLEKPINIKASNEFFTKKKSHYCNSKNLEAIDLTKYNVWNYQTYQARQNSCVEALKFFFEN